MSIRNPTPGLVSKGLEDTLRQELQSKGMQVWLDKKNEYSPFVDSLRARWESGDFPYPICAFRGSFLELMLQLDGLFEGTQNRPVLIHMPGFNFDEVRATPVLEHYQAGKVEQKALRTVVSNAAGPLIKRATLSRAR